jgi:hypothetical protein
MRRVDARRVTGMVLAMAQWRAVDGVPAAPAEGLRGH